MNFWDKEKKGTHCRRTGASNPALGSVLIMHESGIQREQEVRMKRTFPGARIAAALLGFLGVIIACSCIGPASAQSIDELYKAAKAEGGLVLYGGGPAALYEPWAREFEQRFPGIKVTVTAGFSNILAPQIDEKIRRKQLDVDLTIFQTLQDYARWKNAGALMSFKPESFDQIDPSFKDADGQYVAVAIYGLSYAYNTEKVKKSQVPKSALDFLKPEFAGQTITCYPHDDDVTLYLYQTIVDKYGWEFMDRLKANHPAYVRGHLGVARSVSSGEKTLTFDTMANITLAEARAGKPTAIAVSETDPLPIWPQTTAIFKDAPHPNAAKLYITWFLQKDTQARIGTWSPRADVPPPAGLKPLFSYNLANGFRAFITQEETKLNALRKRYESYTGPVAGTPTIR